MTPSLNATPRPPTGTAQSGISTTVKKIITAPECKQRYLAALKAMQKLSGADVVIGANDGVSFDPASRWGYWKSVPHHSKLFVEASPPIFAKLQRNFAGMPNTVLLNRAVRGEGQAPRLVLHCWNMPMLEVLSANYTLDAPPFVGFKPARYWEACCSMNRDQLYAMVKLLPGQKRAWGPEVRERKRREVDRYIVQHDVETVTPGELIAQAGPDRVRYVQIDVEGMDKQIMEALPFGRDGFRPSMILFEGYSTGPALESLLSSHGYSACCCLHSQGVNMVVVPT